MLEEVARSYFRFRGESAAKERIFHMENELQNITNAAPTVAKIANEHARAIGEERDAKAQVLAAAIETAQPALSAITYKIESSQRTFWPDSVRTETEYETYQQDGLRLGGPGPLCDYPTAIDGLYKGRALYLLEDGTLVNVRYRGNWSRWQGASSGWKAEFTPITCREAMDKWKLEECIQSISEALDKQLKSKREEATAEAKARTAKLLALTELLRK
jgi:hypothetical protein